VSVLKIIMTLRLCEMRERVNKDSAAWSNLICWLDWAECIRLYKC